MARLSNQDYYVAVTNMRIIIIPFKKFTGKVDSENVFSVDFNNVEINKNEFKIHLQNDCHLKLNFAMGYKLSSLLDKEELITSIHNGQQINKGDSCEE